MATSAKRLFESALSLDDQERAELIGLLLGSFENDADDGVNLAWKEEVSRRVAELDSGVVQMITWPNRRQGSDQQEAGVGPT